MTDINELIKETSKTKNLTAEEIELIRRAFDFSQKYHHGQKRRNNEPYFNHAYETALKISQWRLDAATIAAALLHDVVEDTDCSIEEIQKQLQKCSLVNLSK